MQRGFFNVTAGGIYSYQWTLKGEVYSQSPSMSYLLLKSICSACCICHRSFDHAWIDRDYTLVLHALGKCLILARLTAGLYCNTAYTGSITFQSKLLIVDSCLVVSYSAVNNNLHIWFRILKLLQNKKNHGGF